MNKQVSDRYLGEKGLEYESARQPQQNDPGYAIDFSYFKPYLNKDYTVLDFGCGNGGILSYVQSCVARVDGVEVNPSARVLAQRHGATIYDRLEKIPVDVRYDLIFSNHVLEHVRDVCGTLELLRARLVPGGKLILKLPFDDANSAYQRKWEADDIDHHLYTWSPRLLANLLDETGYKVQSCSLITSAWHPKLFFAQKLGIGRFVYWVFAVLKKRRQTFAIAVNPVD
jgi:SAM-dependent methyltransferase